MARLELRKFIDGDPGKSQEPKIDGEYKVSVTEACQPDEAQLISSRIADSKRHVVAIDVDLPCHLIESSPGKHHLIIEKAITWEQYRVLLVALEAAGIIEPGYLEASLVRRATYLRIHPATPLTVNVAESEVAFR